MIYSSDQGFYLGDHGWFDKRFMYEESYRMPLAVRWPGMVKPKSVNHNLVSNLDFAQTFLEIAGATQPDDMQGRSLKPLMMSGPSSKGAAPTPPLTIGFDRSLVDCSQPDWRDSLYYHYYEFHGNRRTAHMVRRHYGIRTDRFKLIHFYNLDEWELYDLARDPREMTSLHDDPEYASVMDNLKERVAALQKEYKVPDDRGSVPKVPEIQKRVR